MGKSATLPTYGAALVDAGGRASGEYYRYFQSLNTNLLNYNAIEAQIEDLESRVPALTSDVLGFDSIASSGHLSQGTVRVSLIGDVPHPDKTQYYGTNGSSTRGWYSLYDVVKSEILPASNVTITADDTLQTLTIDLADLADSGEGTLQAITVDAKGRVSGTRDATINGTDGHIAVTNGNASAAPPIIDLDAGFVALIDFLQALAPNPRVTSDNSYRVTSDGAYRVTA